MKTVIMAGGRGTRISDDMIQIVIKRLLMQAGIDTRVYSVHKLRHTAATLMYKYGHVDIRNLQMRNLNRFLNTYLNMRKVNKKCFLMGRYTMHLVCW